MSPSLKIAIKIGLVTSVVIIAFWAISQLAIYHYFKTDYYAAIVAIAFLAAGILIAKSRASKNMDKKPLPDLTQKELSILGQIAEGKSNKDIAAENFVELSTVKTHINNIYAKLGVSSRREAVKTYTSRQE